MPITVQAINSEDEFKYISSLYINLLNFLSTNFNEIADIHLAETDTDLSFKVITYDKKEHYFTIVTDSMNRATLDRFTTEVSRNKQITFTCDRVTSVGYIRWCIVEVIEAMGVL